MLRRALAAHAPASQAANSISGHTTTAAQASTFIRGLWSLKRHRR